MTFSPPQRPCLFPLAQLLRTPAVFFGVVMALSGAGAEAVSWRNDIQPLVQKHCTKCHGGVDQEAGLDLRSLEALLQGSDDGPVVTSGDTGKSLLYEVVSPHADTPMPPKGDPLGTES